MNEMIIWTYMKFGWSVVIPPPVKASGSFLLSAAVTDLEADLFIFSAKLTVRPKPFPHLTPTFYWLNSWLSKAPGRSWEQTSGCQEPWWEKPEQDELETF